MAAGGVDVRRRVALALRAPALAVLLVAVIAAATGCGGAAGSGRTAPATAPARAAVHAAASVRISVRPSRYGRILTAGGGRTVYLFTRDRGRTSACYGACASAWPPVLTEGTPAIGPGLRARAGTTRRRGGVRQATYGGHPLYYYIGDARPGQILCQDVAEFGRTWLIVSPRGLAVR
jgi:predicted lipoprotein with Yx(FWY)xxD motif